MTHVWDPAEAFAALARSLAQRPARPLDVPWRGLRESAVLAPFLLVQGVPHLLFTRRPSHLKHHAGQISFPGGARDAADGTALFTALRELNEELGVLPAQVDVLGPLDEIPTPSGFRIAPFVGRLQEGTAVCPSPAEVEELLVVPLPELFAPGRPRVERRAVAGRSWDVYFYETGGHVIWGATGHILHGLLEELAALPSWERWTRR